VTPNKQIFIGTSGYSYKDWVGPFYPPAANREEFLKFYARRFRTVEINYTYYSQPRASVMANMTSKAPELQFAVKAHKSLTHERDDAWEKNADIFIEGLKPLREKGSLAAVLLQFPYSFHYTVANRYYLKKLCEKMLVLQPAVEFRNIEWCRETVYRTLKQMNVATVALDLPDLPGLPSAAPVLTADFFYIRFHGRNRENWWTGNSNTRYDYLYNERELTEWLPIIEHFQSHTRRLLVYFNNHWQAQAVKNAFLLRRLIENS